MAERPFAPPWPPRATPGRMARPKGDCPGCRGQRDRDIRGLLTLLVLLLTFGLAFAQLLLGVEDGATIPPWAAAVLTLVLQGYYMTKGAERHAKAMRRAARARGREGDESDDC